MLVACCVGAGWRVIESADYAIEDEAAFEAFDATFPPKEKGSSTSQDVFNVLASMIYE